jgi:hypothetical protein
MEIRGHGIMLWGEDGTVMTNGQDPGRLHHAGGDQCKEEFRPSPGSRIGWEERETTKQDRLSQSFFSAITAKQFSNHDGLSERYPGDATCLRNYLALVDRPVKALLRPERTEVLGNGHYRYRSRPFSVGPYSVAPTILLNAAYRERELSIQCLYRGSRSTPFGMSFDYAYGLEARLTAAGWGLEARGNVWLESAVLSHAWAQPVGRWVMAELQQRLERRFQAGLGRDLTAWIGDGRINFQLSEHML